MYYQELTILPQSPPPPSPPNPTPTPTTHTHHPHLTLSDSEREWAGRRNTGITSSPNVFFLSTILTSSLRHHSDAA